MPVGVVANNKKLSILPDEPSAPFVCIEPWLGIADSVDTNQNFEEKEGLLKLAPGESDQKNYSITILE